MLTVIHSVTYTVATGHIPIPTTKSSESLPPWRHAHIPQKLLCLAGFREVEWVARHELIQCNATN